MVALKKTDTNYCATIAKIDKIMPLAGCDNIQGALVMSYRVIVGKEHKEGDVGVFFPVETQLADKFLSYNNLYRDNTINKDAAKKGYFENKRRVRCVKLRGNPSEGIFLPLESLGCFTTEYINLEQGMEFNEINGEEVCRKYVIVTAADCAERNRRNKKAVKVSRLVDGAFRLHIDTAQLKKNIHKIQPDDLISITAKCHGTSCVIANCLVKKPLGLFHRVLKYVGIPIVDTHYDIVYASRKVIKNGWYNSNPTHFYGEDIWGTVASEIGPIIPKGFTIYAEIVGYLKSGKYIQNSFDYGCEFLTHKTYIYRITWTNIDGHVFELDWPSIKEFCSKNGLNHVPELYYGPASSIFRYNDTTWDDPENFHKEFIDLIESKYTYDHDCPHCKNTVPYEGVVVRRESFYYPEPLKMKTNNFLCRETKLLDSNETNVEDNQEDVS